MKLLTVLIWESVVVNWVYRTLPVVLVSISSPYGDTTLLVPGIFGEIVETDAPMDI